MSSQYKRSTPRSPWHKLLALCLLLPHTALCAAEPAAAAAAPRWSAAVGRLDVPGQRWEGGQRRHVREQCSATLVAGDNGAADLLISAWHCLEHYSDLSKTIGFAIAAMDGTTLTRAARRLADGGGMFADWAVLQLDRPIPSTQVAALPLSSGPVDAARAIAMAGFTRDDGGNGGRRRLALDAPCTILGETATAIETDCAVRKGASGGAVVQFSVSGHAALCGVISEGDGVGLSRFVPVSAFRHALPRRQY